MHDTSFKANYLRWEEENLAKILIARFSNYSTSLEKKTVLISLKYTIEHELNLQMLFFMGGI